MKRNRFSNKLNKIFNNKIKFSFVSKQSVIIVTKNDKFYEFKKNHCSYTIKNSFIALSDNELKLKSAIEESFIEELSDRQVIDFKDGLSHSIARTIDGKIYSWGSNFMGNLGNGKNDVEQYKPELNKFLLNENFESMSCGRYHTLVLTINGEVYAWGDNESGQIGNSMSGYFECQTSPFKLNAFNGEKVKAISCGSNHSLALTESGRVYSWGWNEMGQLGIGNKEDSDTPKLVKLSELLVIEKISCGFEHSLFLTKEGDIYMCGFDGDTDLEIDDQRCILTPIKLNHSKKFIDFATHYEYNLSAAISNDSVFYIMGHNVENVITKLQKTDFTSFNEIFEHFFQITYNLMDEKVIQFNDELIKNGFFEEYFNDNKRIGEGSFGEVFETCRNSIRSAVKLIKFRVQDENEFLTELETSLIATSLKHENIVEYRDVWLENDYIIKNGTKFNDKNFRLYIAMDLCDKPLNKIIDEIKNNPNLFLHKTLTSLGYFIASEIFIDILKGVNYLHKHNPPIIHRDLKPENIMLATTLSSNVVVKIVDMGLVTLHKFLMPLKCNDLNIRYAEQVLHTTDRGTHKYMAPEVEEVISDVDNTKAKYDTNADVYSLGVIFSELLFIDRDYTNNVNEVSLVNYKYEAAKDLIIQMNKNEPNDRPDCEKLLEKKYLWAFTAEELDAQFFSGNVFKSEVKNESLIFKFIERRIFYHQFIQNGKYEKKFIEKRMIGRGSYGEVFEVNYKCSENLKFAIKKIEFQETYKKEFMERFKNYYSHIVLSNRNIIKYFDIWLENNFGTMIANEIKTFTLFIQMELCNISLKETINEMRSDSNFSLNERLTPLGYYIASEIFIQILEGVDYLHDQNPPIIHSNLNPSNIMLKIERQSSSFIKIVDFGLATIHEYVDPFHLRERGNLKYLAPEVETSTKYDTRAHIYSLGIILQELFLIDINRDNRIQSESQSKSILRNKFLEIYSLYDRMTQKHVSERPDIERILKDKQLWTLNVNEIKQKEEFEKVFKSKESNDSFVYKLLKNMLFFRQL